MDRLGLGYEVVSKRNSAIVYACVRGFGDPRTGESPYADWPCLDAAAQSFGGLVYANDNLVTPALADIFSGTLMGLGVVSAIHHAKKTGKGIKNVGKGISDFIKDKTTNKILVGDLKKYKSI